MGRPENTLDPDAGPVQEFAAGLRELRAAAGKPSYRELARRAHYSASTLARAASGKGLPSLAVTLAFVRACGGDVDAWRDRWEQVANAGPDASDDAATEPPREPGRRWRRGLLFGLPVAAVVASGVLVAALLTTPKGDRHARAVPAATASAAARPAWARQPAKDGSDPKQALCQGDARNLDAQEVALPGRLVVGSVELRYSPSCHAAWARFSGTPALDHMRGITVHVNIRRPADHASRPFKMAYPYDTVWSDMLVTSKGCVQASGYVTVGRTSSTKAQTYCLTGN